jgi:HEAT repeat protein
LRESLETAAKTWSGQAIQVPRTAPAIVKEAVAMLDDTDQELMRQATQRLSEMSLPEATDALVSALTHPLPDVRIEVACKLANRGEVRALPVLIEGVRRRGPWLDLRRRVKPFGAAAIPTLLQCLEDPNSDVRTAAVSALQELSDATVVPKIVKLLSDVNVSVRQTVVCALKEFSSPEALAALEDSIPAWARLLQGEDMHKHMVARQVLAKIDTDGAWLAILSSNAPPDERATALRKVLESAKPETRAAVERALEFWIKRDVVEGSWWVRGTLEEIGSDRARELLLKYSPPAEPS